MATMDEMARRWQGSAAITVTLFVLGFYLAFTAVALLRHGGEPLWFVWLGEKHAQLDPAGRIGYDGQFTYYLALYGPEALPHLDNPPYRLQRILFPAFVYLLAGRSAAVIPWLMVAANLLALALTTQLLAGWLKEQGLSPWYALLYSLYVGTFLAYSRALLEPVALGLAALGMSLWLRQRRGAALLVLALALLAKETNLLFVAGIMAAALCRREWRSATLPALALLPWLAWEGYLLAWLGTLPLLAGPSLAFIPLSGILPHLTPEPGRISGLLFAGLPALALLLFAAGYLIRERGRSVAGWWLLLNGLLVVLMPLAVYDHIMHAGRNAGGLVLALLFLLPAFRPAVRALWLGYLVAPTLVWLLPVLRWAPWLSRI